MNMLEGQEISDHYSKVIDVYNSTPFETDEAYKQWVQQVTLDQLQMTAEHSLADVGGGSGEFSGALRRQMAFKKLLIVEPSAEMLEAAHRNLQVDSAIIKTAEEWGADTTGDKLDRIMIKHAVHHVPKMHEAFSLLRANKLARDGRLLIVTREKFDHDFPFFDAAKEVYSKNSAGLDVITDALKAVGFGNVKVHKEAYMLTVSLDTWCRIVRGRFWSNLSPFTEEEMDAGIAEIRSKYAGQEEIKFEDRNIWIEASNTDR